MHIKRRISVFLVFSLVSFFGWAAIPPQEVLETQSIKPVKMPDFITSDDVARIIPTNLQPGTKDEDLILGRIMDHAVNTFVQGDYFRNTEIGKAAGKMDQVLKTEVSLGASETEDGEVVTEHKLSFQFLAFEQKAYLSYSGFTNFRMTYFGSQGLDLSLNQAISETTTLVLSHTTQDALSRVNMLWAW
jgi:hypothetical protein